MHPDKAKQLALIARKQAAVSVTPGTRKALLEIAENYEKAANGKPK